MILWLTLAQLATGLLATTLLTPSREVGDDYLRFTAVLSAILLAPLAAASQGSVAWLLLTTTASTAAAGLLLSWGLGRLGARLLLPCAVGASIGLGLSAMEYRRELPVGPVQTWLLPADALTSAALLGFIFGAMILGHWYLENTDMPGAPLRRLAAGMGVAAAAKAAILACTLAAYGWPQTRVGVGLSLLLPPGLFYVVRVSVGVGGPLVLAPFVWRTARMQATQSATGILYAAVVLVLIGEMIGNFLMAHTPFPF